MVTPDEADLSYVGWQTFRVELQSSPPCTLKGESSSVAHEERMVKSHLALNRLGLSFEIKIVKIKKA